MSCPGARVRVIGGQLMQQEGPAELLMPLVLAHLRLDPPAQGPLVFHGAFVMNSVEQVRAAEIAFRTGRMGSLQP